jgi:hypothetical protein
LSTKASRWFDPPAVSETIALRAACSISTNPLALLVVWVALGVSASRRPGIPIELASRSRRTRTRKVPSVPLSPLMRAALSSPKLL